MSTSSIALNRYTADQIVAMKKAFAKVNPPSLPAGEWTMDGSALKLMGPDGRPLEMTLDVGTAMVYWKDNGTASIVLEYEADAEGKPKDATGKYLYELFGPEGKSAEAVSKNLPAMVGSKGPKIAGGIKNAAAVAKVVNADLKRHAGKPDLMPAPFKIRPEETGLVCRFSVTVYIRKEAHPAREEGSVPADVQRAFDAAVADGLDVEGNPITEFFKGNPDQTHNAFSATVATGSATCWDIMMRTMNRGKMTWYCKLLAQVTLGGISIRWNPTRKILTCSMYLNRAGLHVFGSHDMSRDGMIGPSEENMAVYADLGLGGSTKRSATEAAGDDTDDEDALAAEVYEQALKKAKLDEE